MNLYIVITDHFELESVKNALSGIGKFYCVIENTFLLSTVLSAVEVRDFIREKSDAQRVFVSKIIPDAAWSNILSESQIIKELFSQE